MSVSLLSGCGNRASSSDVTRNADPLPPPVTNSPLPQAVPAPPNQNPPKLPLPVPPSLSAEELDRRASKFITDVTTILTKRRIFSLYDLNKISDGVDYAVSDATKIYNQLYGHDKTILQVVSFIYDKKIDDFTYCTNMQRSILKLAFGRLKRSLS